MYSQLPKMPRSEAFLLEYEHELCSSLFKTVRLLGLLLALDLTSKGDCMNLKYFLLSNRLAFVISAEEESVLQKTLERSEQRITVVKTGWLETVTDESEFIALMSSKHILGVTNQAAESLKVTTLLFELHLLGVRITDFETVLLQLQQCVPINLTDLMRTVVRNNVHQGTKVRYYTKLKHVFEPVLALFLLIFFAPLLLVVAALIKFTSSGPVLYKQARLGLGGKEFMLLKFRSMLTDAESNGPAWAMAGIDDPRLSPIGGFLRATHLDELPQFWNIVCGELSFIGPRPERKFFSDQLCKVFPAFALRTVVKPGITGWAQTRQGYANSVEDSRHKIEHDFYYILRHSFWMDLVIVLQTLFLITHGGTENKKRKIIISKPGVLQQPLRGTSNA